MDAKIKTIESFNDLLRQAMNEKGVPNMTSLARSIGITRPAVLRWGDRCLPTDPQVEKLARFLGVDLERLRRARDMSKLIRKAPALEDELRMLFYRRERLGLSERPMKIYRSERQLPLLNPRQLPTNHQKFRIDPDISCGLMGPIWAVCDQCLPMKEGALCVVLITDRKIRFDRYDRSIYTGRTAYRVTAILPKE